MRRREFVIMVGGAATTWPLAARGQQNPHLRLVGVLANLTQDDPEEQPRFAVFRESLAKLGWVEGRDIRYEYRLTGR